MKIKHALLRTAAPMLYALAAALAPWHAARAQVTPALPLTIYLSPTGSDNLNGSTPGTAVATLQAALAHAEQALQDGASDVLIEVRDGTYVGQNMVTKGAGPGTRLSIARKANTSARPVFDGGGSAATWLTVNSQSGQAANLTIAGLKVKNYLSAVTLNGSRDDAKRSVNHVVIKNNIFDTIGQSTVVPGAPSFAAIRMVNGDDNLIANNLFTHIRNVQRCALLHAVYMAHDSTGNTIQNNQFENGCGDALRFRDESNHNLVKSNFFKDSWAYTPISDWYCDAEARDDCTKESKECPSLDNVLEANTMLAETLPNQGLSKVYGSDVKSWCPASAGARFIVR